MIKRIKHLEWGQWLMGIFSAVLQGAASSVLAALGIAGADAVGVASVKAMTLGQMGAIVLSGAVVGLAMFIRANPRPQEDVEEVTKPEDGK